MRTFWIAALALAVGCGGDDATEDVGDTGAAPDATDTSTDSGGLDTGDTTDATVDVSDTGGFAVLAPPTAVAGVSIPIVVHAVTEDGTIDAAASGTVELGGLGGLELEATGVLLRRGVGSVTTPWNDTAGTISVGGTDTGVTISPSDQTAVNVSGAIDADTTWPEGSVLHVTGTTTVSEGVTLTIESGAWVLVDDAVNLLVEGNIDVRGSADAPVVFAPSNEAWGGIVLGERGGSFAHTLFFGGGADSSRAFGHSGSQPVLFAEGGVVTLDGCAVQDSPGKAMGARGGSWSISASLVTRTDTGGEFESTAVSVTDSHYMDFPEIDPSPRDDDNDAIYLLGDPSDAEPPRSTITRTTFVRGADDGIDHNGSTVEVTESWIEGFDNECLAASSGGTVTLDDTALVGCGQGLEAGYGAPTVMAHHLLVTECGVGLRFGDNYTREYDGTLTVEDSVVFANTGHAVWNWVFTDDAPAPGHVFVSRSVLDTTEAEAEGGSDNVVGTPTLTDGLVLAADSVGSGLADGGNDPGLRTERPR